MLNNPSIPIVADLAGQNGLATADMKCLGLPQGVADRECRGRLLIVDDGTDQVHKLQTVFEDRGYETVVAANAEEGLAQFNENSFDLVLTDIAKLMEPNYLVGLIQAIIERKQSERRQAAQYEVSRVLAEAGNLSDAGPHLFEVISKVGNWQAGAFWKVNGKAHVLQCEGFWGDSARLSELAGVCRKCTFPLGVELPGRAWHDCQPVWIADLVQEEATLRSLAAVRAGLQNVFALPITLGEEVLGVFEFFGRDAGAPDDRILQVLNGIANQIGQFMERKRLEDYFRQSQKMEAIGKLAGGIAHDFNNLLTVIHGYSEYLLAHIQPADPLRNPTEQIHKAGERAAALTRQLLAFSRKQVLVPQSVDLGGLLTEMQKLLNRLIGEDIDLQLRLQPDLWRVKADPSQIEQVIMNLVVNARDACRSRRTKDGERRTEEKNGEPRTEERDSSPPSVLRPSAQGTVIIEGKNVEIGPAHIKEHPCTKPGDYVMLAVGDNGCGIDETTKTNIFEPFFTTKGNKGTGLGLATVYGIVKQSGGFIEVDSEVGVGTTFKIYLPRDQETKRQGNRETRKQEELADVSLSPCLPVSLPGSGCETLLLAEDQPDLRALVRMILQQKGYRVLEAVSGDAALALCEQDHGTIHLLVTDVVMPNMSGPQLAERLRVERPRMKVLFLSGYTDDAIVRHGVPSAGKPFSFLQKPFNPNTLLSKVREVLDSVE